MTFYVTSPNFQVLSVIINFLLAKNHRENILKRTIAKKSTFWNLGLIENACAPYSSKGAHSLVCAWANFPQMHFRLKIWTCLKKTLSILPMSCPTITNSYLLSAFILHYTNLVSSLFSPFLTNNTLHLFFLLLHTAYKHLNRWKAVKPETWNLKKTIQ